MAKTVANAFIAPSFDLEDPDPLNNAFGEIHPRDKVDLGARLAAAGVAPLYGAELAASLGLQVSASGLEYI